MWGGGRGGVRGCKILGTTLLVASHMLNGSITDIIFVRLFTCLLTVHLYFSYLECVVLNFTENSKGQESKFGYPWPCR